MYAEVASIRANSNCTMYSWSIYPQLPRELEFTSRGVFQGIAKQNLSQTEFTISGHIGSEQYNITIPITVNGCQYGKYLFAVAISGKNNILLRKDGQIIYNTTITYHKDLDHNPICIPYQTYEYTFSCSGIASCQMYIWNLEYTYYMSGETTASYPIEGIMEMNPSHAPTISFPSLITLHIHESTSLFIRVQGIHSNITINPALPYTIEQHNPFIISGYVYYSYNQTFTISTFNAIGNTSITFTLGVDWCPPGLDLVYFQYTGQNKEYERWQVRSMDGDILYGSFEKSMGDAHAMCLTGGSYEVELRNLEEGKKGWERTSRLSVYNKQDKVIAQYKLSEYYSQQLFHFNYMFVVPTKSEWKWSPSPQSNSKWMEKRFSDRKWLTGKAGGWGNFTDSQEIVFMRKQFNFKNKENQFTHVYFAIQHSMACEVDVFLNAKPLAVNVTGNHTDFMTTLFPISILTDRSNILAVQVRRSPIPLPPTPTSPAVVSTNTIDLSTTTTTTTTTTPIVFDMQVMTVATGRIIQSVGGIAMAFQNYSSPSNDPNYAFSENDKESWKAISFPSILRYQFGQDMRVVVNAAYLGMVDHDRPTDLHIQGVNLDESVEELASVRSPHFLRNGGEFIHFDNQKAFPAYQFVFYNSSSENSFTLGDARFYSALEGTCKKRIGYAQSRADSTHIGRCPWFKTGFRQMHCVEEDREVRWVDDRSLCLPAVPAQNTSFVDWSFDLMGITEKKWQEKRGKMTQLLTDNLKVVIDEIGYLFVQDVSVQETAITRVYVRFTLESEIGDYIYKHLHLLNSTFSELAERYLDLTWTQSVQMVSITLHNPINIQLIKAIVITAVVVTVIMLIITLLLVSKRSRTPVKSLQHKSLHKTKKSNNESLLANMA